MLARSSLVVGHRRAMRGCWRSRGRSRSIARRPLRCLRCAPRWAAPRRRRSVRTRMACCRS
ncbi:MAG: hypothetical protein MZU84_04295 [Sphingobacterium sp.]|nr:hypothetical protein [Sphingobacterium sp.]